MSRTDDGGAILPVHERLGPCGREVLPAGGHPMRLLPRLLR
jgi:hypothetical protein